MNEETLDNKNSIENLMDSKVKLPELNDQLVTFEPINLNTEELQNNNIQKISDKEIFSEFSKIHNVVDELAEDMVFVRDRLTKIEQQNSSIFESLKSQQDTIELSYKNNALMINSIKNDLIGDKKSLITKTTFNSIFPAVDSMYILQSFLNVEDDKLLYNRLTGVIDLLNKILQTLGYETFEVEINSLFNPSIMECTGYETGEKNRVIRIVRYGYKSGELIVKPCSVQLGKE